MIHIVSTKEMKDCDQRTCNIQQISSFELMKHAGYELYKYAQKQLFFNENIKTVLLIGPGNNGGDALVLGLHLIKTQHHTTFLVLDETDKRSKENQKILDEVMEKFPESVFFSNQQKEGMNVIEEKIQEADVLVDGIFGIGLQRPIDGYYRQIVEIANRTKTHKIAIDLPTGIDADTGKVLGTAFKADETWIINHYKIGNCLLDASDYHGKRVLIPVGIVDPIQKRNVWLLEEDLPVMKRMKNTHKYDYGHVVVFGGIKETIGASWLSGYAALRTGSGLSTIVLTEEATSAIRYYPEIMVVEDLDRIKFKKKMAVVFGPGLGKKRKLAEKYLNELLKQKVSMVIDADGIDYLKDQIDGIQTNQIIVTPHIAEFAQWVGATIQDVQDNPITYLDALLDQYEITIVLKGVCTIIANRKAYYFSMLGGPELATAGTGDVLAGIIGRYLAQGYDALDAAKWGVVIHSKAGKLAKAQYGEESVIASDIIEKIPEILKT